MVARIRSFPPAVVSYSPSNALAALIDELLQSGSFRNFCSFSLQRPRSAPTTPRPIIQKLPRVRGRNSVGKPPTSLAHAPQSFRPRHREVLKWGQVRYHLIPRPTTLACGRRRFMHSHNRSEYNLKNLGLPVGNQRRNRGLLRAHLCTLRL